MIYCLSEYDSDLALSDIAILRLSEDAPLANKTIYPACLPLDDAETFAGWNATAGGWGMTTKDQVLQFHQPVYLAPMPK